MLFTKWECETLAIAMHQYSAKRLATLGADADPATTIHMIELEERLRIHAELIED